MAEGAIEVHAQFGKDIVKAMVLFLHLLVVASALFGLTRSDEARHAFEDLVRSAQFLDHEVPAVQLQKPVVKLVLFAAPMPLLHVLGLPLSGILLETAIFLLRLLLDLFPGQADMALLAEEGLEIIPGYHLLVVFHQAIDLLGAALIAFYFNFARNCALRFFRARSFVVGGWRLIFFVGVRLFDRISVAHQRIVR